MFEDYSAIHPAFLEAAGLEHVRRMSGDLRAEHPLDSRALRLSVIRRNDLQGDFANGTRRLYRLDTADPTSDRRLIELCLSIPEAQYQHAGVPRSIARTAMADALPPAVVHEYNRGQQAADWAHGFDAAVPRLKEEVARQRASRSLPGWVDLDRFDRLLDGWDGPGSASAGEVVAVTRALAAGRYVRRMEGSNA